jgi:hypothetical protein
MTIQNNIFSTDSFANAAEILALLPVIFVNLLLLNILLDKKQAQFK